MKPAVASLLLVSAAFALTACQPKETVAQPKETVEDKSPVFDTLAGTKWQFVEFQSMDDAQQPLRPATKDAYTIEFAADGKLLAKLDCNRGTGTWKNMISNATGGSLELGPLATTRAMCPDMKVSDFLAKNWEYVRSFTVADGKLNMSLMADGGIIVWERAK